MRKAIPRRNEAAGPNALIDENLPVVVLATRDDSDPEAMTRYEKSVSEHQGSPKRATASSFPLSTTEIISRAKPPITSSNFRLRRSLLVPLLEIIPLQLLAYHIAVRRGCDVDQPRNLAKSVTVE